MHSHLLYLGRNLVSYGDVTFHRLPRFHECRRWPTQLGLDAPVANRYLPRDCRLNRKLGISPHVMWHVHALMRGEGCIPLWRIDLVNRFQLTFIFSLGNSTEPLREWCNRGAPWTQCLLLFHCLIDDLFKICIYLTHLQKPTHFICC